MQFEIIALRNFGWTVLGGEGCDKSILSISCT